MNFLKKFLIRLKNASASTQSDTEKSVLFHLFSRWIYESSKMNTARTKVHYSLFRPDGDLEISVSAIDRLSETEIWELEGDTGRRDKQVLARADIYRRQIIEAGLNLKLYEDHVRHYGIAGWPQKATDGTRAAQIEHQKRLEAYVTENNGLHLAPGG